MVQNPFTQTTQATSPTTSGSSSADKRAQTSPQSMGMVTSSTEAKPEMPANVQDLLYSMVLQPSARSQGWIEVSDELFDRFMGSHSKSGHKEDSFHLHSVRVYRMGMKEKLDKAERLQVGQLLHGDREGVIVSGG